MTRLVVVFIFMTLGLAIVTISTLMARAHRRQAEQEKPVVSVRVESASPTAAPPPVAPAESSVAEPEPTPVPAPTLVPDSGAAPAGNKLFQSLRAPTDMRVPLPADTAEWADLMPPRNSDLTELARDCSVVRTPAAGAALIIDGQESDAFALLFPDQPAGVVEYLLAFHHTGRPEQAALKLILPMGDRSITLWADPAIGLGLGPIQGVGPDRNGTAQPHARILPDRSCQLYLKLDSTADAGRLRTVTVALDGQLLLQWTGKAADLPAAGTPVFSLGGSRTTLTLTHFKRRVVDP